MKRRIEAFRIKPGPTESGEIPEPIGGELLPTDILPTFLSQYWLLIVLFLIPLGLLFYKKRDRIFPLMLKLLVR